MHAKLTNVTTYGIKNYIHATMNVWR